MGSQIPQTALQGCPIVEPRADHHLGVNLQIPFTKPGQLLHQQPGPRIHQKALSQVRFSGVHRYIKRRQPLLIDALPIRLREVGEGEIRAIEEAETEVVILEIQAVPVAGRLLIDEAERTVVVALPQPIKECFRKAKAQAVVGVLL